MLDDLIDGVAREITDSQPSAALARRVAARIGELEPDSAARRKWRSVWLVAPAATCIILLGALAVRDWRGWQPPVELKPNTIRTIPVESTAPEPLAPVVAPTRTTPLAQAQRPPLHAEPWSMPPAVVTVSDPDLAPLVTTPLEIGPLGVAPLAQAVPIEVDAVSILRIDIAAMP